MLRKLLPRALASGTLIPALLLVPIVLAGTPAPAKASDVDVIIGVPWFLGLTYHDRDRHRKHGHHSKYRYGHHGDRYGKHHYYRGRDWHHRHHDRSRYWTHDRDYQIHRHRYGYRDGIHYFHPGRKYRPRGCHPVEKVDYWHGRRARIGGTMCYDHRGYSYVVPHSRFVIYYY